MDEYMWFGIPGCQSPTMPSWVFSLFPFLFFLLFLLKKQSYNLGKYPWNLWHHLLKRKKKKKKKGSSYCAHSWHEWQRIVTFFRIFSIRCRDGSMFYTMKFGVSSFVTKCAKAICKGITTWIITLGNVCRLGFEARLRVTWVKKWEVSTDTGIGML